MKKLSILMAALVMTIICLPARSQNVAEIRLYQVNRVTGSPPAIDGNYTEAEWAGSQWTSNFYGTRHSFNTRGQGEPVDSNRRWRALWDDDYLYILLNADLTYINPNGWVWEGGAGKLVPPLMADDTGYAGWARAECIDFEFHFSPNWEEDVTIFLNDVGQNPPGYHLVYFPLLEDEGFADSNFGVRGAAGPPFFHTNTAGAPAIPGGWNPITGAAEAAAAGVKPLQLAAEPHLVPGVEPDGSRIVGSAVLEIAIPYSQLGFVALPNVNVIEDVSIDHEFLIMLPDANGKYVQPGDEWLFNVESYTEGPLADTGLALVNWNDMGDGGFHNAPRGKLIFQEGAALKAWMLH